MKDINENERFLESERYINDMNEQERKRFQHKAARDRVLEDYMRQETEYKPKVRRISIKRKHLYSAGFASVLCFYVLFLTHVFTHEDQNDQIFANYYKTYLIDNREFPRISVSKSDFSLAYKFYNEGNYRAAIDQFQGIYKSDTTRVTACFLLGMSFIERRNYPEAIKYLSSVIDQNSAIGKQAEWYLGLCYLKTGDKIKAVTAFKSIMSSKNYYRPLATEILRRLNQI